MYLLDVNARTLFPRFLYVRFIYANVSSRLCQCRRRPLLFKTRYCYGHLIAFTRSCHPPYFHSAIFHRITLTLHKTYNGRRGRNDNKRKTDGAQSLCFFLRTHTKSYQYCKNSEVATRWDGRSVASVRNSVHVS